MNLQIPAKTALEYQGLSLTFKYVNYGVREPMDSDMANFKVEFRGNVYDFSYGVGHFYDDVPRVTISIDKIRKEYLRGALIYHNHASEARLKAFEPKAEDFIHALLGEIDILDLTFEDFCSEYGYSSDSMSALKVYNLTVESARKFKFSTTPAMIDNFRTLLEDY